MEEFNLKATFKFIKRNFKVLAVTFVVSAVVTAGITLLLPNYYKAQVVLLPSDTNSISKGVLSNMDNVDPMNFGSSSDCEYVLDIINSGRIVGAACTKFNLAEHYGIKASGRELDEKMGRKLYNNIKVKRTDNLGVKITVWDTDPEMASNLANFIASEVTVVRSEAKKVKYDSICSVVERSRDRISKEIDLLTDSLSKLSKEYKVFYPDGMGERFAQELAKQVAAGNTAAVNRLEAKMLALEEAGAKITNLREQLYNNRKYLSQWNEFLEKANVDREAQIPVEYIIQAATPSYSKDKPKRSIIVLTSAICCTLLALFVLVVRDKTEGNKVC
ncbi:MAG: hypothetical protein PUJ75_04530 [Bacteroidales bacterium]|nr:hypothetical protein [Bacteroidales bacterium]MDD6165137.1 hypothetical protein [Bacteroidales bacterium]MDD7574955.1 hypothetical protein [Bacteroidales bacterium]MDY5788784.1 hypothetical protein [Candidatus Onthomorpha sp.]MDY5922383.1 hypothetical protein [Candidatus Onthomorpha sp.]